MNFFTFVISISCSMIGAFLDFYTSYLFIKDGGIELERNKRVRSNLGKGNYREELFLEAQIITIIGIVDSTEIFNKFVFLGLIYLASKSLIASDNLKVIIKSRAIGMKKYLENELPLRQALTSISLGKKVEYKLSNLLSAFICLFLFLILLTVDFPFIMVSRSLILGFFYYFILVI